jgi:5'-nucleotidase / UDP-sugar diphosphatase
MRVPRAGRQGRIRHEPRPGRQRLGLLALGISLSLGPAWGCTPSEGMEARDLSAAPRLERVILLHDNDTHFHDNHRDEVLSWLETMRAGSDPVYLLSAGDLVGRNEDRWLEGGGLRWYEAQGRRMIDRMNTLGYDVATLGNHELDIKLEAGRNVTREVLEEARFPWIVANILSEPDHLPTHEPFRILGGGEAGPSLAVVGLSVINFDPVAGMEQEDFHEAAARYRHLADEHDAIVLLTHIGIRYDIELANRFPEISAILGGHTNTLLPQAVHVNGVLVAQAGGNGHVPDETREPFMGVAVLEFEDRRLVRSCGWVVRIGPEGVRLTGDAGPQNDWSPSAAPRCAA